MTGKPDLPRVLAISAHADFEPEGLRDGLITWTFVASRETVVSAGLYELRLIRPLHDYEQAGPLAQVLAAAAMS
jgi:hypothetical protein